MQKLVNIYPIKPILNVNPPIRTRVLQITIDTDMIRKCLISGAIVEEILNGGKTKTLTLSNYDKDNDSKVEEKPVVGEPKVEAPKVEESVKSQQQFKKFNKYNNNNNRRHVEAPKVETPKVEEKPVVEEPKVEEIAKSEEDVEATKVEETVKPEESTEKE